MSESREQLAPKSAVRVDGDAIVRLRELEQLGKPGLIRRLVASFRQSSGKLLNQIEQSVSSGDREAARRAAHALKSSSAQLGARHVSELALALEQSARDRNLANAEDLADLLSHSLEEALAMLDAIVAADGTP